MPNRNVIQTYGFSNPEAQGMYGDEPEVEESRLNGDQCGGCSFFAPFNSDYGLCAHPESRHRLETVFEHFSCPSHQPEGWGPHSFSKDSRCICGGSDDIDTPARAPLHAILDEALATDREQAVETLVERLISSKLVTSIVKEALDDVFGGRELRAQLMSVLAEHEKRFP
ncbi:MAG: hypothetical protein AAFX94_02930 [Myxococcota bacterium]